MVHIVYSRVRSKVYSKENDITSEPFIIKSTDGLTLEYYVCNFPEFAESNFLCCLIWFGLVKNSGTLHFFSILLQSLRSFLNEASVLLCRPF